MEKKFVRIATAGSVDSTALRLLYWGQEQCRPEHTWGPGVRDHVKLHFIHAGRGVVKSGGFTHPVEKGQAFIAFPDRVVSYQADREEPWAYSWVAFDGERAGELLERTSLSPERPVFGMDEETMPAIVERLASAYAEERSRDLRMMSLMYQLLAALVDTVPGSRETDSALKPKGGYVQKGVAYIHARYSNEMTVQQIAAYLGLDRKYVSALFKEALGVSPQQYLLRYRMRKACELIEGGRLTVGEVARSVGYQDALLFSRMFKKVVGMSPRHYRA
ncbi:AraC family transcriptional regulator [Paenibacillus sp. MBLB4367]|uniref:AraC family transcriptional regulator n=1 Tax=Paenibacillus sp. MBLB4367 TaxID=3384767 RepID=UPI003907F2FF